MFWLISLTLTLVASLFILWPILRSRHESVLDKRDDINVTLYRERLLELEASDPDGREQLVLDAEKDLLADVGSQPARPLKNQGDKRLVLVFAVLMPVFALLIYSDVGIGRGAYPDVELTRQLEQLDAGNPDESRLFADRVAARLAQRPDDPDLQFLMARAFSSLGEFRQAAGIYEQMLGEYPHDPSLASHYAEVLFIAEDRQMTEEVAAAVDSALRLNPADITMLEIKAIAAIGKGDAAQAARWFRQALQAGASGRRAELIHAAMSRLEQQAGTPGAKSEEEPPAEAASGPALEVSVSALPDLPLPSSSAVFVFARAAQGPPMPLAVQRLTLADLPARIRLDSSMAMMPGMSLGDFSRVVVVARLSSTGTVAPSPGDFEARSGVLDLGEEPVQLSLEISSPVQASP